MNNQMKEIDKNISLKLTVFEQSPDFKNRAKRLSFFKKLKEERIKQYKKVLESLEDPEEAEILKHKVDAEEKKLKIVKKLIKEDHHRNGIYY